MNLKEYIRNIDRDLTSFKCKGCNSTTGVNPYRIRVYEDLGCDFEFYCRTCGSITCYGRYTFNQLYESYKDFKKTKVVNDIIGLLSYGSTHRSKIRGVENYDELIKSLAEKYYRVEVFSIKNIVRSLWDTVKEKKQYF